MSNWQPRQAVLSFLFLTLWTVTGVYADSGTGEGLKPDLRLLIDISGSMKQSDPENLRAPALDLIVRLLPEGAKAGVWIFAEDVKTLVEHRVIDEQWRQQAQQAVANIDNSGQRTNIPAALKSVTYDFGRMDGAYRTSIVLLTDGKVDVSESPLANANAAKTLLAELAPELGSTGIAVHTIALSQEADWEFLRSLATQTSGLAEMAETAGELTEIFLQALEMVAPTARVPIADSRFQIDSSVSEFTLLVFMEDNSGDLALIGPQGHRFSSQLQEEGVDWFRNRKFALVTVTSPESGEWRLEAPNSTMTRLTVISDLQLEVDPLPNSLPTGQRTELGLRLRERGTVLTSAELLALFAITVEVSGPNGDSQIIEVSQRYDLPADGEYRIAIPAFEIAGRYQVMVRVNGETLQRELPMFVEVTGTPSNPAINTKGAELPDDNLFQIGIVAGCGLLLALAILLGYLRRRRQRSLAQWQRRYRETATAPADEVLIKGLQANGKPGGEP
ncbi:MAG: hypothetical protein ACI9B9_002404 [Halioglobus sp.]|jgi:hypothetical protein